MKKEFNLSKKVIQGNLRYASDMVYLKDVKEFIKLLKECPCGCGAIEEDEYWIWKIDKLAGEELK